MRVLYSVACLMSLNDVNDDSLDIKCFHVNANELVICMFEKCVDRRVIKYDSAGSKPSNYTY